MKALGIVIPTHNRAEALLECLAHLEHQTFGDFEVVVVDDGSTDSTSAQVRAYMESTPLTMRYTAQQNSGPAKARNLGISLLQTPVCLLLGDDIFASPTLVQTHMKVHEDNPMPEVAALGLTRWSTKGQEVTSFMRWLGESPFQFAYKDLLAGAHPGWHHFYTSNLSVKTELLKHYPFSEEFPFAAMEDSELGYRLTRQCGLELRFLPKAVAYHLHPTTFRQACARMIRVGYSARLFHGLWPEAKPDRPKGWKQSAKEAIVQRPRLMHFLTAAGEICVPLLCPNPLMVWALVCHYEVGYRSSLTDRRHLVRSC